MNCQKCNSERIANITGKCSDLCCVTVGTRRHSGYVPNDMGVGGSDYLKITVCLECGQLQGTWPLPKAEMETPLVCPQCNFEGMPIDVRDELPSYKDKRGYQCYSCEERFTAEDWGFEGYD